MKTFKNFREGVEEDEVEAYSEETCNECGCDRKNPKEDCDCDHKSVEEGAYGKKKKMKEEVEEIEEISKKTLGSYIKKATISYGSRERMGKEFERDAKETRSATDKKTNSSLADTFQKGAVKRKAGIMKATDKLVNKKN
jgi:uncharacterized membrane protein YvbJ